MHIPEHLIEPLVTFVRLCRNANEGDRLEKIRTRMSELHPELSDEQMTDVIQHGANLFVSKTNEQDPTLAMEARRTAQRRKK